MIYDKIFSCHIPLTTLMAFKRSKMPHSIAIVTDDSEEKCYSISVGNCVDYDFYMMFLIQSRLARYSDEFNMVLIFEPEKIYTWIEEINAKHGTQITIDSLFNNGEPYAYLVEI